MGRSQVRGSVSSRTVLFLRLMLMYFRFAEVIRLVFRAPASRSPIDALVVRRFIRVWVWRRYFEVSDTIVLRCPELIGRCSESKYGFAASGNVLRISLLRAATGPDAEQDQGAHKFSWAVAPHVGHFIESDVPIAAYLFNSPLHRPSPLPYAPHSIRR